MVLISLLVLGGAGIKVRNNYISKIKMIQSDSSGIPFSSYSPLPTTPIASDTLSPSNTPSPSDSNVLGTSTDSVGSANFGGADTPPTLTPFPTTPPLPTYTPIPQPSSTPFPTTTPSPISSPSSLIPPSSSSPHSCAGMGVSPGVPTAWYSETSSPQTVGSTTTVNIQLRDCNNNTAPVSDTLTITQSLGPVTTVNGYPPPMTVETTNGQGSFSVNSQTSGTAVYIVTDTTQSFAITDPHNNPPQVTFTISTPTSGPTLSPALSPTPSETTTPTPTLTSTPTSSPTLTLTPTPIPTRSLTPSQTPSVTLTPKPTPT